MKNMKLPTIWALAVLLFSMDMVFAEQSQGESEACPSGMYFDIFKARCELLEDDRPTDMPQSSCVAECQENSISVNNLVNPMSFSACVMADCAGYDSEEEFRAQMQSPCEPNQFWDMIKGTCVPMSGNQPGDDSPGVCLTQCTANSTTRGGLLNPVSWGRCAANC